VVDNASIATRPRDTFAPETAKKLGRPREAAPERITVLSRSDLRIYVFVEAQDLPAMRGLKLRRNRSLKVELRNGDRRLDMYSVRVLDYMEFPADLIRGRFFFVIDTQARAKSHQPRRGAARGS
jgi:hypothetical protein